MATKTPIKKTTTKKTVKTNQKKGFLDNTRNRFVVTVLFIAILGGGFFVYKSFAATASWTFLPSGGLSTAATAPCKAAKATEASKNNLAIINLSCTGSGGSASASVVGSAIPVSLVNQSFRLCATIKGTGYVNVGLSVPTLSGNSTTNTSVPATGSYKDACTQYAVKATKAGAVIGAVKVNTNGSSVSVSQLRLEQLSSNYGSTGSVGSVAAPAPTK